METQTESSRCTMASSVALNCSSWPSKRRKLYSRRTPTYLQLIASKLVATCYTRSFSSPWVAWLYMYIYIWWAYNLRSSDFTQAFTPHCYQGLRCLANANADLFVETIYSPIVMLLSTPSRRKVCCEKCMKEFLLLIYVLSSAQVISVPT